METTPAAKGAPVVGAFRERVISTVIESREHDLCKYDSEIPTLQSGERPLSPAALQWALTSGQAGETPRERDAAISDAPAKPGITSLDLQSKSSNDVHPATDEPASDPSVASDWIRWTCIVVGCESDASPCDTAATDDSRPPTLTVEFERETEFFTDIARDLFEIGIFIPTYRAIQVGTLLSLSFELPCGTKITAPGEVRWLRGSRNDCRPGIGVAITFLSKKARAAIEQFCSEHEPMYVEL
jgi:Tfp pilus assembly protein PilZ